MKRIALPFEVPFRVFVAITFAGTIAFHLIGLGIHTYIARQKSHLVTHIESLAEIRSQVLGLESSISVLRERTGRILDRSLYPEKKRGGAKGMRSLSAQFHVVRLLLGNFERAGADPTERGLVSLWDKNSRSLLECRPEFKKDPASCLGRLQGQLSGFLGQIGKVRGRVEGRLVTVEKRQSSLEHWDTTLYWLTTIMGLLFMAMGWRNVVLQVGNPIQDVANYLETYQEKVSSVKSSIPALFSIRELRVLKESMTNVHNDYLTGILARHAIMGVLAREISLANRHRTPLAVAIFDVDWFKKVNDQYGHPAGDRALKHVVSKIRESCRQSDWLGRWGGEEFLLVCPNLTKNEALSRLDEIREKIREPLEISPSVQITLSASAGAAFFPPAPDLDSLVGTADKALYLAKETGRNRVVLG